MSGSDEGALQAGDEGGEGEKRPIGALDDMGTLNGVSFAEIERHLRAVHELLCQANLVRAPALASYNGWTADGRAVRHSFKVSGYERTGPKVEQERRAREAGSAAGRGDTTGGDSPGSA